MAPKTGQLYVNLTSDLPRSSGEPAETYHRIELPLTTLHYAECGEGEPLIMVPATISLIEDWLPYVHFVGQRFHTHFFELPGHGGSTAFEEPFSSDLVAEAVEQFADSLGFERFALMGFSFGGALTMKILQRMGDRVTKVIVLSPFVSHRGLEHSPNSLRAVRLAAASARRRYAREVMLRIMRDPVTVRAFAWFMTSIGKYETSADLKAKLMSFSDSSFDTLASQVAEILSTTEDDLAGPFTQPCFFGMSTIDPLLDFETSLRFMEENFTDLFVERWDFPFHAPPEPFTFDQLNENYGSLLNSVFA